MPQSIPTEHAPEGWLLKPTLYQNPRASLSRRYADAARPLPLDAGGDAELVLLRVGQSDPSGPAKVLHVLVDAPCAQYLKSVHLGLDVVDDQVEVHPVLDRLGFGHPLQEKRRC